MGLVPLLLPFAWVLELDSCGHSPAVETELTGSSFIAKFDAEAWLIIGTVLALTVLTPFLANLLERPLYRLLTHLLGLVAPGFSAYGAGMLLFFSIFTDRQPRPAGWVFLGLFVLSSLDAVLRVVWSVQEWLASRGR